MTLASWKCAFRAAAHCPSPTDARRFAIAAHARLNYLLFASFALDPTPFGLFRSYKPFPCHHARHGGRQLWQLRPSECGRCERQRRGLRKLRIQVSEDDLRQIAQPAMKAPQAPTRISRRRPSACFSRGPSANLFAVTRSLQRQSDSVTSRAVSRDDVTLALLCHGDAPPTSTPAAARWADGPSPSGRS